ncbi:hypothetical protein GUITHDRAFT_109682 [Guillardia theta CCMP2712]|uniref:Uncharacterized protein n=1 Tax=Guillardia theta (strain CCMP2712) TaxID=905079 RepID=L1J6Q1_GUITC|nr:hypothetical protein GUITHDRAFT_109682 [Guillardia theta CCMP2712]EKX44223.1 hypothetical protein GUITHDRAFT_109682 [Guillardia theta CCMP2712]|eukprot:XP_005831203.1 hypothetical protein GUITHDRAFT_109682 [Guillardia theta CCMP2712]
MIWTNYPRSFKVSSLPMLFTVRRLSDGMMFDALIANFDGINLRLKTVNELRIDTTTYELDVVHFALVTVNIYIVVFPPVQTSNDVFSIAFLQSAVRMKQLVGRKLIPSIHDSLWGFLNQTEDRESSKASTM